MKHIVSVCAVGSVILILTAVAGAVSLFNISWAVIFYLLLGGVIFTIGLAVFHERSQPR